MREIDNQHKKAWDRRFRSWKILYALEGARQKSTICVNANWENRVKSNDKQMRTKKQAEATNLKIHLSNIDYSPEILLNSRRGRANRFTVKHDRRKQTETENREKRIKTDSVRKREVQKGDREGGREEDDGLLENVFVSGNSDRDCRRRRRSFQLFVFIIKCFPVLLSLLFQVCLTNVFLFLLLLKSVAKYSDIVLLLVHFLLL